MNQNFKMFLPFFVVSHHMLYSLRPTVSRNAARFRLSLLRLGFQSAHFNKSSVTCVSGSLLDCCHPLTVQIQILCNCSEYAFYETLDRVRSRSRQHSRQFEQ